MKFLLYKGISPISKAIRWQTRSEYSHVAGELRDGSVVEAWHKGGVVRSGSFRTLHTPGTEVDVFMVPMSEDFERELEEWLLAQVGKGYDFRSVFRFVTRREAPLDDKWFCSEMYLFGMKRLGEPLLRGNPSEQSPRDFSLSPKLEFIETRIC